MYASFNRAGELSTEIAMGTLTYLDKEHDLVPWLAAKTQIDYLDEMLRKTDIYGEFKVIEYKYTKQCQFSQNYLND